MRGGLAIAALLLVVAFPAIAEPWIDYELLRRMHADKVFIRTESDGKVSWRLDMGDGVTVSCPSGRCFGMDSDVAMGCLFYVFAHTKAVADACSLPMTPDARNRLEAHYERFGRFVAENAVPRQEWSMLRGFADGLEKSTRDDVAAGLDAGCAAVAAHSAMPRKLEALSHPLSAEEEAQFDRALSRPRLPVMLPCF